MAQNPLAILNRLMGLHLRSLPAYLSSAQPWFASADSPAENALRHIAEDQRIMANRLGAVILEHGGTIQSSEFPMEFTDLNDLSIDYLLQLVRQSLEDDIVDIRQCIDQLQDAPAPAPSPRRHSEPLELI